MALRPVAIDRDALTRASDLRDQPLSAQLGPGLIIFMVLATAAPLSVVAGLGPIGILAGNGLGFPAPFILIATVLLLFSVGFTAITPKVKESGGFCRCIRAKLGFLAGTTATFVAIVSYVAMQVGIHPYAGLLISISAGADVDGVTTSGWGHVHTSYRDPTNDCANSVTQQAASGMGGAPGGAAPGA